MGRNTYARPLNLNLDETDPKTERAVRLLLARTLGADLDLIGATPPYARRSRPLDNAGENTAPK
jgi:hypothetical protein